MQVYLDNAATTQVDEKAVKEMEKALVKEYGNPSSIHSKGHLALEILDNVREILAKEINCEPIEIIFTSCGTEANNLALNSLEKGDHLIISELEHPSIYNKAKELEKEGVEVTFLGSDKEGFVKIDELKSSIKENTRMISVMHINNEIGTIQDLEEIGKICKNNNILFHSDCVQSLKKEKIDVKKFNLDFASFSAHKIHGPKGIGALYFKKGSKITPLIYGGGQENKLRSGTENVAGIAGFGEVLKQDFENEKIKELRDYLISGIVNNIDNVKLNGSKEKRVCNNVNISFKSIEGESILMSLDIDGIFVSTGSACSSRALKASRVLLALGLNHEEAHGSIRFSLSKHNTKEELDYVIEKLKIIVKRLRGMSAL